MELEIETPWIMKMQHTLRFSIENPTIEKIQKTIYDAIWEIFNISRHGSFANVWILDGEYRIETDQQLQERLKKTQSFQAIFVKD